MRYKMLLWPHANARYQGEALKLAWSELELMLERLVPGAQITGMIRSILVSPAIDRIDKALGGMDQGIFKEAASKMFCIKLNIFGTQIDTGFMLLYSVLAILIFTVLNIALFSISSKRKD